MKILYYPGQTMPEGDYAATIGFFDGVHLGHRFLIGQLQAEARSRGLRTVVVTFERHPRQVVQPQWQPRLLSSLAEKAHFIEEMGIDVLVVLRFDEAMSRLTARQFMQWVLKERLRVSLLLTGYDNRFGHDRTETFDDYARYGREMGLEVVCGRPCEDGEMRYSSSLVRRLLTEGDVATAARCLGRRYTLQGMVVHGRQIGRTLGFPTANLVPCNSAQIVPQFGVYCVMIQAELWPDSALGVMNIGMRPTFDGHEPTLEVNVLDFEGDLYGQVLTVAFVARLRPEQSFDTPQQLAAQMQRDADEARKILKNL